MDLVYSTVNIYDSLRSKYSEYLKPEIVSIQILQTEDSVYLESVITEVVVGGLEKQTVQRINLDFIVEDFVADRLMFSPKDPIEDNARKFIDELSPYSIVNTTDLFHEKACEKISRKFFTFGIDR